MAVRRESVLLELEDHFTREVLEAAAAAKALEKSLNSLSGSAVQSHRGLTQTQRDVDSLGRSSQRAGNQIDRLSGRVALFAKIGATVGPAIAPISAVALAGLGGLASQAGFAATGAMSLIVAFQGVGDALKAVNDAALEPTAKNIEKAQQAMARLGPEAQAFVNEFQRMRPVFAELRDSAAAGWFPGLTEALGDVERMAPVVERILRAVGTAGGDLIANGAESLASGRWAEFFTFIENEAPAAMTALGRTVGSLAHGFSRLWMAFDPLNDGMRDWLVDVSRGFDSWASGLSRTEGFAEFVAYVQQNGPKVADAAVAISNAILQIGEAAAPLGGPVLDAITDLANAIAAIADSPIGTPLMAVVTALSAANLASKALSGSLRALGVSAAVAGTGLDAAGGKATTAGSRFMAAGKSVGIALAAFEGFKAVGDGLDSFNRWRDTAGETAKTTEELAAVLQGSNIGKYAEDLGINVGKLADDLVKYGENGEYAREVQAKLGEQFSSFGGRVKGATDNLLPFNQESDKARMAGMDFHNVLKGNAELIGSGADATERAAASTAKFSRMTEGATRWQQNYRAKLIAARDAARESASAFLDFSDAIAGSTFSFQGWITAFEKQVQALADWRDNLQTLREGGLAQPVLDALIEQGPAAAQAVEELADRGKPAIERLNRAFREGKRELDGVGADAARAADKVEELGKKKANPKADLADQGFQSKQRAMDANLGRLDKRTVKPKAELNKAPFDGSVAKANAALAGLDKKNPTPHVELSGVSAVEAALNNLARPRTATIYAHYRPAGSGQGQKDSPGVGSADGSTVPDDGGPYADRFPYMLAPGEEVISNRRGQADRWRPLLKAINAGRLADGGTAGGNRVPALEFAGLPGLRLAAMNLRGLNRALRLSEKALEKEKKQRDAVVSKLSDLRSNVASNLRSELFGEVDPWRSSSMGGSFNSAMGTLRADITRGKEFRADVASLKRKGLNGEALDELLRQDPATVDQFSRLTRAQLTQFERAFEQRQRVTAGAGQAAGVAAYGVELKQANHQLAKVVDRVERLERALKAEHAEDRRAAKRGASQGARDGKRG